MTPGETQPTQPTRTTITRAEANKILAMVRQRTAKVPKALITRCLIITGDITGEMA